MTPSERQGIAAPLWAILIEGPDDVYAMPSEGAAQEHAAMLNAAPPLPGAVSVQGEPE